MNILSEILDDCYETVRVLVEEIGTRPAGSDGEKAAFRYIEEQLERWGYEIRHIPVSYAPLPGFSAIPLLGGIYLALNATLLGIFPWTAILAPLIILTYPQFCRWAIRRRRRTHWTEESLADLKTPAQNKGGLIICAHVDSARAYAFESDRGLRLYDSGLYLAQRAAIAISLVGIFLLLKFTVPPFLVTVTSGAGILIGMVWMGMEIYNQLGKPVRYSPGAYDNASGVGIALGLAQYYAMFPPEKIHLRFLFTTAEETGLHGSEAYLQSEGEQSSVAVINLDMVGAGNRLQWVTKEGVLFPIKTNQIINQFISKADDAASGIWYTRRSGDYLPFLEHHIPASSLQTGGNICAERYYHSVKDGMEIIQQSALDHTLRTMVKFIDLFEQYGVQELFKEE